ncbi:MAG TPA: (d)CMP kinase [Burkholderiales bacterium]|jgi:cytidylate kinase|nr:(d)CMP kinase [Burkholderiales bacterium]
MPDSSVPVIAIDGPSASGKGTIAQRVALALGFHYLDSGALYRLVGWIAISRGIDLDNESGLSDIAMNMNIKMSGEEIFVEDREVSNELRTEAAGAAASRVAALPGVRAALLERQLGFRRTPGLVADGRDMGSTVFPDAIVKIFLTASAEERAKRRYNQLIKKGLSANIRTLLQEIRERDARDSQRSVAPLQKSADAFEVDTTGLPIDEVTAIVLARSRQALMAP